jgi:hypothetical protein
MCHPRKASNAQHAVVAEPRGMPHCKRKNYADAADFSRAASRERAESARSCVDRNLLFVHRDLHHACAAEETVTAREPAARILLRGKTAMTAAAEHQGPSTWISTAAALPVQGQSVEFMLAARECPIIGVYSGDGFRSRWTHYASELVSRWRGAIGETAFDPEAARH